MDGMGKLLIIGGIVMIILGLMALGKLGPLGHLPGDILIERENSKIYIPLTTSIIVSVVVSAILWILNK